jgi:ubiquinone/menaquinone biosynthesis C-methylase UbiE
MDTRSTIKNPFENPIEYKNNSKLQQFFSSELIKKFIIESPHFKNSHRILDIGCGDGKITRNLADLVPKGQVIGTDISEKMIDFCIKENLSSPKNNLGYMLMDAEKNIFQYQFDIITSFFCLHWVQNLNKALIGIKNALANHGRTIILIPLKHELHDIIEQIASTQKWSTYFKDFTNPRVFLTPEQYSKLFDISGLEKQIFSVENMAYTFHTKQELMSFMGAAIPHMKVIPKLRHEEFLDETVSHFLKKSALMSTQITLMAPMLMICARKAKLSVDNQSRMFLEKTEHNAITSIKSKL